MLQAKAALDGGPASYKIVSEALRAPSDTGSDTSHDAMPILPSQTSMFPKDLLEGLPTEAPGRCWWAVYTRSRQEKALARQLAAWEIPFFLPLIPRDNLIRGRRVQSYVPLFGGYVFLFASEEERTRTLTTNRISRILSVEDQELLYGDLRQVWRLIESGAPLTIEHRLMPGRLVRVKSGAMMGLEGVVLSRRSGSRLLVAVNFLQRGASVAIDDFQLEPLD